MALASYRAAYQTFLASISGGERALRRGKQITVAKRRALRRTSRRHRRGERRRDRDLRQNRAAAEHVCAELHPSLEALCRGARANASSGSGRWRYRCAGWRCAPLRTISTSGVRRRTAACGAQWRSENDERKMRSLRISAILART